MGGVGQQPGGGALRIAARVVGQQAEGHQPFQQLQLLRGHRITFAGGQPGQQSQQGPLRIG